MTYLFSLGSRGRDPCDITRLPAFVMESSAWIVYAAAEKKADLRCVEQKQNKYSYWCIQPSYVIKRVRMIPRLGMLCTQVALGLACSCLFSSCFALGASCKLCPCCLERFSLCQWWARTLSIFDILYNFIKYIPKYIYIVKEYTRYMQNTTRRRRGRPARCGRPALNKKAEDLRDLVAPWIIWIIMYRKQFV